MSRTPLIEEALTYSIVGASHEVYNVLNKVIVESKASVRLPVQASKQLCAYLTATRFEVGLLIHFGPFGVAHFRVVSSNPDSSERPLPWSSRLFNHKAEH